MLFLFKYGQKSKQANTEHRNPAGKHTRYSYFFISSLMKRTSGMIGNLLPSCTIIRVNSAFSLVEYCALLQYMRTVDIISWCEVLELNIFAGGGGLVSISFLLYKFKGTL